MSAPILLACYFRAKSEPDGQYDRLARVLAHTARVHCPEWDIRVEPITPSPLKAASGNPSHEWNTYKLDYWQEVVDALPDGARLLLMDADTTIVRPLDALWELPFDLAYTIRSAHATPRIPFNGGVVALRVSEGTRAALRRWRAENRRMLDDRAHHLVWRRKYAGINQASFGLMLEDGGFADLDVKALPCQEWNCVEWSELAQNTRIVHYKSALRRATFGMIALPSLRPLVADWHALERAALQAEARG